MAAAVEDAAGEEQLAVAAAVEEVPVAAAVEEAAVQDTPPIVTETAYTGSAVVYSVQIMALRKPVDLGRFPGTDRVTVAYGSDRWYRYTVGRTTREQEAVQTLERMISKGYRDAFIRRKGLDPRYTIQIMAVPGPVVDLSGFSGLDEIMVDKGEDLYCRYTTGEFETEADAAAMLEIIKSLGYKKAFIRRVD